MFTFLKVPINSEKVQWEKRFHRVLDGALFVIFGNSCVINIFLRFTILVMWTWKVAGFLRWLLSSQSHQEVAHQTSFKLHPTKIRRNLYPLPLNCQILLSYMFTDISSVSPFLSFVLSLIATWDLRIGAVYRARSQPVWFGTTVIWPPWRFASPPPQCFSDRDILKRWARECVGSEDGEWKGFSAWGRGVVQVWGTVLARRGAGSWEPSKGNSGRVRQDAQGGGQVLRRGWIVSCLQKDKNIDLTLLIHQRVPSQWSRHLPVQLREEDRLHIEGIGTSEDKSKRGGDGRVVC